LASNKPSEISLAGEHSIRLVGLAKQRRKLEELPLATGRQGRALPTAPRKLSFATERLYRRAIALQRQTIDPRGASLSVLL